MKALGVIALLLCAGTWSKGQLVELLDAVSGAPNPNGALTREIRVYSNRSVPKGALAVVTATWSCPSLDAAIDDNLGDRYTVLAGPIASGPIRVQHWYTLTRIRGPEYLAPRVTLNGRCAAGGRAFNSVYLQLAIFTGADPGDPVDRSSVTVGSGNAPAMALYVHASDPTEIAVATFVTSGVGAPFTLPSGWTGWLTGEAVAANAYSRGPSHPQFAATASSPSPWSGMVFGIRSRRTEKDPRRAQPGESR